MMIFTFNGHISVTQLKSFDDIVDEGIEQTFIGFPALLGLHSGSNFLAIIFFLMMIVLGIDG